MQTYSSGSENVLSEEKSLGLDDEEVNQLIQIASHAIQSLLWNCVISSWADLGDQSSVEKGLSSELSGSSQSERHPGDLERIAKKIEVASTENEHHNGDIGNGRGTWVLPAEKTGEEGVVVGEVLAGSSALVWTLASVDEVRELVSSLLSLCGQVLSNWACVGS